MGALERRNSRGEEELTLMDLSGLVFKCANLLRQATLGLLIGYYAGCSILRVGLTGAAHSQRNGVVAEAY